MSSMYNYDRRRLASVSVKIDMGKASEKISDYLSDLASRPNRHPEDGPGYTDEEAAKDAKRITGDIEKAMKEMAEVVLSAAHRLHNWAGSTIQIRPLLNDEDPIWNYDGDQRDFKDAYIYVDKSTPTSRSPSFMMSMEGTKPYIDDVLDGGDTDFFHTPEVESDYFSLVNELRHPGSGEREGEKKITLYTARPAKDHDLYAHATHIPTNVFLTTSFSEAEGYAMDMKDREIWQIRIKSKYLVETLDAGGRKNYQAIAPGSSVPVESITPA